MEKLVSKLAGLGVPGLVLLTAIHATGLAGGAAIVTALAALGPGGIIGGITTLGIIALCAQGLTEFGLEAIFSSVVLELVRRGETKTSILEKIDNYPLSSSLKCKLREEVNLCFYYTEAST